ncbi:MAG: ABC transporter substrate-binding protein [Ilumatobacteraceae bacterium]
MPVSSRRRVRLAPFLVAAVTLSACGSSSDGATADPTDAPADSTMTDSTTGASSAPDSSSCAAGKTLTDGTLTIATGEPAFPPYVVDDTPENKQGFESAVAWAVADQMGFGDDTVTWVRTTFDEAIQPGPKSFDFNLQQYSISPERAQTISFSDPYYTSNQAIVGLNGSAAEGATTLADLKGVKFGVQAGTTSLNFVNDVIQPDDDVFVYDDNVGAKAALEANQIDAIIVDLPTAFYISAAEIENSSVIAQFPASAGGTTDEFGMVFEQDNPLVQCVNDALASLKDSGELDAITEQWMSTEMGAPVIELG